jgi:hypothetical protein
MKTHKDLDIWKNGLDLVTEVYGLTKNFPKEETYGLSAQMRRAAVSYPSNIAEGAARNSKNLGYTSDVEKLLNEIEILRKMTLNFIKHLKGGREESR